MHCDMLKIKDGFAMVEKLIFKNIYYAIDKTFKANNFAIIIFFVETVSVGTDKL